MPSQACSISAIFVAHLADFFRRDENRQVRGGLQRRQATEKRSTETIARDQSAA